MKITCNHVTDWVSNLAYSVLIYSTTDPDDDDDDDDDNEDNDDNDENDDDDNNEDSDVTIHTTAVV